MLKHLFIPSLAFLAACATPQERCINSATNEVRTLQKLIATSEGNIARGYAIHKQEQPYKVASICYDKDKKPYACLETEFRTVETPVTIDIAEERRKLAQLKHRLPDAKRRMNDGIKRCRVQYPE